MKSTTLNGHKANCYKAQHLVFDEMSELTPEEIAALNMVIPPSGRFIHFQHTPRKTWLQRHWLAIATIILMLVGGYFLLMNFIEVAYDLSTPIVKVMEIKR